MPSVARVMHVRDKKQYATWELAQAEGSSSTRYREWRDYYTAKIHRARETLWRYRTNDTHPTPTRGTTMHVDTLTMLFPESFDKAAIADGWALVWIVPDESTGLVRELYIERADDEWAEALEVEGGVKNLSIKTDEEAREYVKAQAQLGNHPHTLAHELVTKFEAEQRAKEKAG